MTSDDRPFTLEFYVEPDTGRAPVHEWITSDLSPFQRRSLGVAMSEILERQGVQVCGGEYGKQLGHGLFEFRLCGTVPTRSRRCSRRESLTAATGKRSCSASTATRTVTRSCCCSSDPDDALARELGAMGLL